MSERLLVLVRHGESEWNKENRFTGWTDVDLTPKGREEAGEAARLLLEGGYTFDVAFTSLLKRAIRTLWITLDGMDLMWIPVHRSWRLNERHYGTLQGLNKAETAARHGEQQVKVWRRSYDIRPPDLESSDPRFPGHERRYARGELAGASHRAHYPDLRRCGLRCRGGEPGDDRRAKHRRHDPEASAAGSARGHAEVPGCGLDR